MPGVQPVTTAPPASTARASGAAGSRRAASVNGASAVPASCAVKATVRVTRWMPGYSQIVTGWPGAACRAARARSRAFSNVWTGAASLPAWLSEPDGAT
ncbi:MAG: hypothetical protein BWX70_03112 [Verrucomicrobia bacterium ADurb.Bin070]|nr:MAG: hypothetical protein BWX70_03112 [Verrucomicrobia bacterium ADurb.Bin070]